MSDLTFQDILNILRLIDSGSFSDFLIEFEGTKLKLSRRTGILPDGDRGEASEFRPTESAAAAQESDGISQVDDQRAIAEVAPAAGAIGNQVHIKSPMAGTFYCAPAPGAPPFVAVGQTVAQGDKLGIVEVMKLFTAIQSPCDGVVRAVLVQNEEAVLNAQTLMTIETAE